jgi:hypothetical protein
MDLWREVFAIFSDGPFVPQVELSWPFYQLFLGDSIFC